MYMGDLSKYTYHQYDGLSGVLPVGWLSADHPFAKGIVSRELLEKLTQLAVFKSMNFTRGVHVCEFCGGSELIAEVGGVVKLLGTAEIWIPGQRALYASPNLIVHYIATHNYRPPEEYLAALETLDVDEWSPPRDYIAANRPERE